MAKRMNGLDITATSLLIAGGLNWGLVALFDYDIVEVVAGYTPEALMLGKVIKVLVGGSAVYAGVKLAN